MTKIELEKLTTKELKEIKATIKIIMWERFKKAYQNKLNNQKQKK